MIRHFSLQFSNLVFLTLWEQCSEVAVVCGLRSASARERSTWLLETPWALLEDLGVRKKRGQTFSAQSLAMPQQLLQCVLLSETVHCTVLTASKETLQGTWCNAVPFLHCVTSCFLQHVYAEVLLWVFIIKYLSQALCVHLVTLHLGLLFHYLRMGHVKTWGLLLWDRARRITIAAVLVFSSMEAWSNYFNVI